MASSSKELKLLGSTLHSSQYLHVLCMYFVCTLYVHCIMYIHMLTNLSQIDRDMQVGLRYTVKLDNSCITLSFGLLTCSMNSTNSVKISKTLVENKDIWTKILDLYHIKRYGKLRPR